MQETKADEAMKDREAEATTDETLTDLEEQQEIAETSETGEIAAPDAQPTPAQRDDEELM